MHERPRPLYNEGALEINWENLSYKVRFIESF